MATARGSGATRGARPPARLGAAQRRTWALLEPSRRPRDPEVAHGYLDLIGHRAPASPGLGQSLMLTRALPQVYEHLWRPAMGRLAKGVLGPGMADEYAIARDLLDLRSGQTVLDVACGPGNFSRDFAAAVGPRGLVVGLDASPTMLDRAVTDTRAGNVAYLRADAGDLPFGDGRLDAVCCFAALNLFGEPMRALAEMARVLAPGGHIALFTSLSSLPRRWRAVDGAVRVLTGVTMFDRDELVGALADRRFDTIEQRRSGLTQFVGGRRGAQPPS